MLLPTNGISIAQGEDQTLEITVTDSAGNTEDLTGARLVLNVKADPSDKTPVILKTTDNVQQAQIIKALAGYVRFYITSADTSKLEPARYFYDVWVILSSGKRYPVIKTSVFQVTGSTFRF
jgi:hypothetical protein